MKIRVNPPRLNPNKPEDQKPRDFNGVEPQASHGLKNINQQISRGPTTKVTSFQRPEVPVNQQPEAPRRRNATNFTKTAHPAYTTGKNNWVVINYLRDSMGLSSQQSGKLVKALKNPHFEQQMMV